VIPEPKLRALREALRRDHYVRFHNGSYIEYEDCPRCHGDCRITRPGRLEHEAYERTACPRCDGEGVMLLVTRSAGGVSRFRESELHRAYEMALNGPRSKEQPSSDGSKFGDDPPW
jgi:hypothetical protein